MIDSTMPHPFEFKWGAIPISFDCHKRTVTLSIENVDEPLRVWLESIYGTGHEEAALVAKVEAAVAAGEDTTAIEGELVAFYRTQNWRAQV